MKIRSIGRRLVDFKNWSPKDYVTILPLEIVLLMNIFVIIAFRDVGIFGVTVMFSIIIGASPYFIYNYFHFRKIKEAEDQMPNFLRDMVESVRSGMNFDVAIQTATKADYGKLSGEIKKMYHQMTWGVPFDNALQGFSKRLEGSDLITRTVKIIMEARKSGGDVVSVMETIASDVAIIKETEKDRRSATSKQVVIMYLIYFMFIGIVIALTKILIPISNLSLGGAGSAVFGSAAGPCAGDIGGLTGGICSFFLSISKVFGLGETIEGYYKSLFLMMILIQGIFTGLIAGQIGEDSVYAGVKHSMIVTGIGFSVFMIVLKAGFI